MRIGAAVSAALHVGPVEDEQGLEVGDIYSVGTVFCIRMTDLRRFVLYEELYCIEIQQKNIRTTVHYLQPANLKHCL